MSDRCDDFRELVCYVGRRLTGEDVKELKYMFNLPHQCGASSLDALLELERTGVFSKSLPEGLRQVLEKIERKDLLERVDGYIEKRREKMVRPQLLKLIGEHGASCREVDDKVQALATRLKEMDTLRVLREEKASGEGATATQLLLQLLDELQSASADCVQQCSVLESVACRSTCDSPPCTGMRYVYIVVYTRLLVQCSRNSLDQLITHRD